MLHEGVLFLAEHQRSHFVFCTLMESFPPLSNRFIIQACMQTHWIRTVYPISLKCLALFPFCRTLAFSAMYLDICSYLNFKPLDCIVYAYSLLPNSKPSSVCNLKLCPIPQKLDHQFSPCAYLKCDPVWP